MCIENMFTRKPRVDRNVHTKFRHTFNKIHFFRFVKKINKPLCFTYMLQQTLVQGFHAILFICFGIF